MKNTVPLNEYDPEKHGNLDAIESKAVPINQAKKTLDTMLTILGIKEKVKEAHSLAEESITSLLKHPEVGKVNIAIELKLGKIIITQAGK